MSKKYKVNNTENLFNKFQLLSSQIINLSSIIQNEGVEIELEELKIWGNRFKIVESQLQELKNSVIEHILDSEIKEE